MVLLLLGVDVEDADPGLLGALSAGSESIEAHVAHAGALQTREGASHYELVPGVGPAVHGSEIFFRVEGDGSWSEPDLIPDLEFSGQAEVSHSDASRLDSLC